jgi:uncharacterized protein
MFIGRQIELDILNRAYKLDKAQLVAIYGRRRIGKSSLVESFLVNKKKCYTFEAIEDQNTESQIQHFIAQLSAQINDPLLNQMIFNNWDDVFKYLTQRVIVKNTVIFFDELQWMAIKRGKLISLIKYYWDNHWKQKGLMLILCGSIASFMVKKVISSKALYGRINTEILLKGLSPSEASSILKKKRSDEEILNYQLIFGGVPRYLEEINLNKSFLQNINVLCFEKNSLMINEISRVFYSQFREIKTYFKIIELLKHRLCSLEEISTSLGMSSGGGLKEYLVNLEQAEIISSFIPFDRQIRSKIKKYKLADEYTIFYFSFVEPVLRTISNGNTDQLFERVSKNKLDVFLGFAFERFCLKHANYLAKLMNFGNSVEVAAPAFGRNDSKFQVDMVYKRFDKVITICEIKHYNKPVTPEVIIEVEKKKSLIKIPTGYTLETALISTYGASPALLKSDYFNNILTMKQILSGNKVN